MVLLITPDDKDQLSLIQKAFSSHLAALSMKFVRASEAKCQELQPEIDETNKFLNMIEEQIAHLKTEEKDSTSR